MAGLGPYITTEVGQVVDTEGGQRILLAGSAPLLSSASFSPTDWANRVAALFPVPWRSTAALTVSGPAATNGILGSLMQGIGYGLASVWAQLVYAKMQTRLATATDTNLDAASVDFFGAGLFPRATGEPDRAYQARIQAALFYDCTIPGITRLVQMFLANFTNAAPNQLLMGFDTQGGADTAAGIDDPVAPTQNAPAQMMSMDTSGGVDTWGVLDVAAPQGELPTVIVFDQQTNPTLCAAVTPTPIVAPSFGIYLQYANYANTPKVVAPPSPILAALVNLYRATPCIPVYCANYP